jgi:uncharacterized membrane protein YhaH (DUF805 family)
MSLLFSFAGRIPRYQWWIRSLCIFAFVVVSSLVEVSIFGLGSRPDTVGLLEILMFDLVWLYASYCIAAKRFQDRGKPAFYAQIAVAVWLVKSILDLIGTTHQPIYNSIDYSFSLVFIAIFVWFIVELGCLRGTVGPNQYGPDPVRSA